MGIKISELTEATSVNSLDAFALVQSGVTKKIEFQTMVDAFAIGSASGTDFFFDDTASDIATYYVMASLPTGGAEVDDFVSVSSATSPALIEAYASPTGGLGRTSIDAGIWIFNIYGYTSSANNSNKLTLNVYKRTAAGAETLLFSVSTPELTAILSLYRISSVQSSFAVNTTDRLVIKVYAETTAVVARDIHFVHNGTTHYSNIRTPLIQNHNDLGGLQGGTLDEYYHLTAAQISSLAGFVPYTGASAAVDLGAQDLKTTGKIYLNANSYLTYNTGTSKVELWVGGVLNSQWG